MQLLSAVGVAFFLMQSNLYDQEAKKSDTLGKESNIEEVVLVGYGTQKKTTNAGSAATLKNKSY
ncbi:hypothetical protein [Elizabethkingia sp. JS20170427COW]|uniref:hypothetical protein n=1 Tax=Elizabethkingia sp. JS20170427COW TaxID=2583851 RepID=UPI00143D7CE5|nr:hypothetical protein [Elizabethkingia sp. JS20170427COW]